jgi:DNA-binding transcriptional MerR regulator/methylmalonyl-CoA mutase cobalamin-binding subunit
MLVREPRVQAPALEAFSDVPLFNTKAVVHQTGVPAPTLRAWERRYGILAPRRGENDYRLYSERDIAMVSWLRERVESGMTISQAIALLRSLEPARRRGRRATQPPAVPATQPAEPPGRLALDEMTTALVQHFKALDEAAAKQVISQALAVYTVEDVCLRLVTPALYEIGRLWAAGHVGAAVEHFAAALIRGQLDNLYHLAAGGQTGPLVLAGCAPGELHEIGALMLALFLRRAGLRVAYLGQSVDARSLVSVTQSARPAAVVLSATMPAHAASLVETAEALRQAVKPGLHLFVGGQGFAADVQLASRVPGHYLPLNAPEATQEIRKRIMA